MHAWSFGHSLGSVIAYDVLSGYCGPDSEKMAEMPKLDFEIDTYFLWGRRSDLVTVYRGLLVTLGNLISSGGGDQQFQFFKFPQLS